VFKAYGLTLGWRPSPAEAGGVGPGIYRSPRLRQPPPPRQRSGRRTGGRSGGGGGALGGGAAGDGRGTYSKHAGYNTDTRLLATMTAYTHRAKRAHYGVNDKVEKKAFQKDKNSDDKGGGNGCDKDKGKDLKNKICWLCGHVKWRSDEFCTQCGTNCFVPVCLGTLILVILYDFLILYLIRMKEFLRSTDDVVSAAITLCSQSNTKTGKDGHFTLSVLKSSFTHTTL